MPNKSVAKKKSSDHHAKHASPKKPDSKHVDAKKHPVKSVAKPAPAKHAAPKHPAPVKHVGKPDVKHDSKHAKHAEKPAEKHHDAKPSDKNVLLKKPAKPEPKAATTKAKQSAGKTALANSAIFGNPGRHSDAGGEVCREVACEGLGTTAGYCRMHYIKNWKKIKRKELILKEKRLNQYIEELVAKYPDKYIEAIRQDLANDKDFAKVIYDLDLDESVDDYDADAESADSFIDTIKRDFEDEGEGF